MVILNSVIQYFPDIHYLMHVLEHAVERVAPGGFIFIGDVRSLPLLPTLHAAMQLHQANDSLSLAQLQQRIDLCIHQEEELLIAPLFFLAFARTLSRISHVEIAPKHGQYFNELTQFRYQVLLHVDGCHKPTEIPWLDWQQDHLSLDRLCQLLLADRPEHLGVKGIPNLRLARSVQTRQALANEEWRKEWQTVAHLRRWLAQNQSDGVDPEAVWQVVGHLPYVVTLNWADPGSDGSFDLILRRRDCPEIAVLLPGMDEAQRPWAAYANNPFEGASSRQLVPLVRQFLQERLPGYMVPATFVILERFPLNPNGKIDRRALPSPELVAIEDVGEYAAPATPTETTLAAILEKTLNLERVGRHDNFFDLGGDSIMAIQVASSAEQAGLTLSTKHIFQHQTIAELAQIATPVQPEQNGEQPQQELSLLPGMVQLMQVEPAQLQQAYQAFLFESTDSLDVEALQSAFNALLGQHEALRVCFPSSEEAFLLDINAEANAFSFAVYEIAGVAEGVGLDDYVQRLAGELQPATGLLLAAAVLRNYGTRDHLLLVAQELALDADSWAIVAQDLGRAYHQARHGQAVELPASTKLARLSAVFHTHLASNTVLADLEQWQIQSQMPDKQSDSSLPAVYCTMIRDMDVERTTAVLQTLPSAYHLEVHELLTFSLAWALHQMHETPEVSLAIESRNVQAIANTVETRTVGRLATTYPITLTMPSGPLPAALPTLKESLREQISCAFSLVLGQTIADVETRRMLAAVQQPAVRLRYCTLPQMNGSLAAVANVTSPSAVAGPYLLDVCAAVQYKKLTLRYSFDSARLAAAEVEQLLHYTSLALEQLVTHYEAVGEQAYTPSDFPMAQLDSHKLNTLLNNLAGSNDE
jgi:hypothetical protein